MGPYVTVLFLMLAGWTFIDTAIAWGYIAAVLAFEAWLLLKIRSLGNDPVPADAPPYSFSDEEARLVGRHRLYFTYPRVARQSASVLAAIGLTSLVLAPWLSIKLQFVEAAIIGINLFAVARFTKALSPLGAHGPTWAKIRAANQKE